MYICDMVNIIEQSSSGIEIFITPLNKNITDGIIDNNNAFNLLFSFLSIAQER